MSDPEKIILDFVKAITDKKEQFIKSCFEKRGYAAALSTMDKLFPDVAMKCEMGWDCWYARGENNVPVFIVAIKDKTPTFDLNKDCAAIMLQEFYYTEDIKQIGL